MIIAHLIQGSFFVVEGSQPEPQVVWSGAVNCCSSYTHYYPVVTHVVLCDGGDFWVSQTKLRDRLDALGSTYSASGHLLYVMVRL